MTTDTPSQGILSANRSDDREEIIGLLTKAYWMEIETVMSYVANRIKELYGVVPGSLDFRAEQSYLQPPAEQTDIVHVIKGVIEAESGAIEHYNKIVDYCDDRDLVTQDMVIEILHDEERHRRLFEGFLREYQAEGLA